MRFNLFKRNKDKTKKYRHPLKILTLVALSFIAVIAPFIIVQLLNPSSSDAAWYNTSWNFRKQITIQDSKVSGSSNFSNFPVLINIQDSNLGASAQSDADDILFTSDNGTTQLSHEIERYDSTTGTLYAWVEVSTLYAQQDTNIFMYYGNANASSQQAATATWNDGSSNYKAVYHLDENPASTCTGTKEVCDSTSNDNDGDANGSMTATDQVDAKVYKGIDFDGSNDYISVTDAASLEFGSSENITISAWFKASSSAGDDVHIVSKNGDAISDVYQMKLAFGCIRVSAKDGSFIGPNDFTSNTCGLRDDLWHHAAFTYNHTSGAGVLYLDGVSDATSTDSGAGTIGTAGTLVIAAEETPGSYFPGVIDELRISNSLRNSDWIATEYNNQSSPTTFITKSPQETQRDRVLHWGFNEGSGTTANDSSGNNNAGTISGATWQAEEGCFIDKCLKFDGSNDVVSKTYSGDTDLDPGSASFSVGGWFRHSSTISGTDTMISRADGLNGVGYKLYMNSSGNMCFGIDGSAGSFPSDSTCSTASYADSKWHYVQGVKSGTTSITVYIDGKQVGTPDTSITSSSISGTSSIFRVGIDADGSSNPWDGFIDEVGYYDIERTASQIKADLASIGGSEGSSITIGDNNGENSLSNGLVGYWKLDENTGTSTTDASGNGFTGTLTNSPTWTSAGKFGPAVSFDGAQVSNSDVIDIGDQSALELSTFTISAWIYRSGACAFSTCPIFSKGMSGNIGYALELQDISGYKAVISIRDGLQSVTGTTTISTDTWYHLAATVNGSTIKLYVNGILEGQAVQTVPTTFGNETVKIGNRNSNNDVTHNGRIDDVRVYNREISSIEVQALYDWAPGPSGHWKFDEKAGTSTMDSSGNGYNGTLTGGPTWASGKFGAALNFDNSDDYIATSDSLDFTDGQDFTVTGWVNKSAADSDSIITKKTGTNATAGWLVRLNSANRISVDIADGTDEFELRGDTALATNQWGHFAVVIDRDTAITIYINGVPTSTTVVTGTVVTTVNDLSNALTLRLGAESDAGDPFSGKMDDIKVYNYARTSKQIISDMNAGHPSVGTPVGAAAGHWSFDEGYGTTVNDKSPNGNNLSSGGVFSTSMWTNSGKFGKAWNGQSANWLTRADDADFDFAAGEDFAISFWVKSDSATNPSTDEYVLSKESASAGYNVRFIASTGELQCGIDDDTTSFPEDSAGNNAADTDWYDNQWHHFVCVRNTVAGRIDLYADGKLFHSDTSLSATGSLANSDSLTLGDRNATNDADEFNGDIDETKIYRAALDEDQVKVEYNQGKSEVLGSLSTTSGGVVADNSSAREYCIPGDTTTCDAPIGHWKLDENTGSSTVNDSSTNGFALTFSGFTGTRRFWSKGKIGSAIDFDGVNDVLFFDDALAADGGLLDVADGEDFTIETWVYKTNNSADHGLIGKKSSAAGSGDEGYSLMHYSTGNGGNICFYASDGTDQWEMCTANNILTAGQWYHVAAVFDDASETLSNIYINGVPSKSTTAGTLANVGTLINGVDFEVGAINTALTPLNGRLDDAKMFLYTRTPAQIAWDYNRGTPVAHWKLDECTGTSANDSSGNSLTGTITPGAGSNTSAGTCNSGAGTEMWDDGTTGKFNSSLGFDGTDDYVSVADSSVLDITGDITVSLWAKPSVVDTSTDILLEKGDGTNATSRAFGIRINGSSLWSGAFYNTSGGSDVFASNITPVVGRWDHVVITRTSTIDRIYVNGQQAGSSSLSGTLNNTSTILAIGRPGSLGSNYFNGQIDDVRIYNYALSATQVKTVYNENAAVRFGPQTGSP
jgi:hypothetical protein